MQVGGTTPAATGTLAGPGTRGRPSFRIRGGQGLDKAQDDPSADLARIVPRAREPTACRFRHSIEEQVTARRLWQSIGMICLYCTATVFNILGGIGVVVLAGIVITGPAFIVAVIQEHSPEPVAVQSMPCEPEFSWIDSFLPLRASLTAEGLGITHPGLRDGFPRRLAISLMLGADALCSRRPICSGVLTHAGKYLIHGVAKELLYRRRLKVCTLHFPQQYCAAHLAPCRGSL